MIRGDGPAPALVISLIDGLPPGSMSVSYLLGGEDDWRDYFERGPEWYALADLFDAVNQGTRATGQWKKKAPKFDPYPRPGMDADGKKKKQDKKKTADGDKPQRKTLRGLYAELTGSR